MKKSKINVALVGLGFGAEFIPIYLHHPNVESLTICDSNNKVLQKIGAKFMVNRCVNDFETILKSDEYDAVHLVTPIPLHAEQSIKILESGKHCACTVPMATSIEDLRAIVDAQHASKKNYMMMETAVYTRHFLYVQELNERGDFGRIQLLRGAHYQDMEYWPSYWLGLPPMHYATHAVSPLLSIADTRSVFVHCLGSGKMRRELYQKYRNPFPIETAIFQLEKEHLVAEVTRSLFHTAKAYTESFIVYGENMTFEWQQIEDEDPVLYKIGSLQPPSTIQFRSGRSRKVTVERVIPPDYASRLPAEIQRFTRKGVYDETHPHLSFLQGGGHGGSHPHLVHEFISSIIENRKPWIDEAGAANWTAPGICAHESAMNGGHVIEIPQF
jgi:predicted dehydrogenase